MQKTNVRKRQHNAAFKTLSQYNFAPRGRPSPPRQREQSRWEDAWERSGGGTEVATKTVREEEVGTAQDEQQEARWGGGAGREEGE